MREDLIYFEQWKQRQCPIDREQCTADQCAFFEVLGKKLERGKFTDGIGYCTLPELTADELEEVRRATGHGNKRSRIDMGSYDANIPGNSSRFNQ